MVVSERPTSGIHLGLDCPMQSEHAVMMDMHGQVVSALGGGVGCGQNISMRGAHAEQEGQKTFFSN